MDTYKLEFISCYLLVVILLIANCNKCKKVNFNLILIILVCLHTILTLGGYDYTVYDYHVKYEINKFSFKELFDFYSTEIYLYPFLKLSATLKIDFYYLYGLSVYTLVLLFMFLTNKNLKYRLILSFIAMLTSPSAPFLFGNTIRQGYASLFIIWLLIYIANKSTNINYLLYIGSVFHKSLLVVYMPLFKIKKYIFFLLISISIVLVFIFFYDIKTFVIKFYFDNIISYHEGEQFSLSNFIMKIFLFLYPLIFFYKKNLFLERKNLLLILFVLIISIISWEISEKAANRFVYYFVPLSISYIAYKDDIKLIYYIIFINIFISSVMLVMGKFDMLWLHNPA